MRGLRLARKVYGNPQVWMLCLIYFTIVMASTASPSGCPHSSRLRGFKILCTSDCSAPSHLLCAIVAINLVGHSSDARLERRWHLILPCVASAVGFVVSAAYPGNTFISLIFLSLAAAGVLAATSQFWSLPTTLLSGTAAAAGIAVMDSVGNLAGFLSPALIGYLKDALRDNAYGMYALALHPRGRRRHGIRIPAKLVNR